MTAVAIIPARGGSKGIPRKNLAMCGGKPLIAWAIEAALAAKTLSGVYVSTEDAEIADVARSSGAGVVDRPAELASDIATSEAVLLDAIHHLSPHPERSVLHAHVTVLLQCTSPLTLPEDIDGCVNPMLTRANLGCCFTATPFHGFVWRGQREVLHYSHENDRFGRQLLGGFWLETGAVYAIRTRGLLSSGRRFSGPLLPWQVPSERAHEIDTPAELELCDYLLRKRQGAA